MSTDDFRKVVEAVSGQDLGYFFIQWIESSGAPEFKLEYTIFRTQKGFRVMGKISQDLDTFRMPVDLKIETEGNPEEKRWKWSARRRSSPWTPSASPRASSIDPGQPGAALQPGDSRRGGHPARRAVRRAQRVRRGAEGVPEGAARRSATVRWRITASPRSTSCRATGSPPPTNFAKRLNGDLEPKWTEVWAHINLGKIFDVTGQRDRAVNEYNLAIRTKDNTQGAQEEAGKYLKTAYERQRRVEQ